LLTTCLQSTIKRQRECCRETNTGAVVSCHTSSNWFLPELTSWVIRNTITLHLHDCDGHILTIFICSYCFTICINISPIVIPRFPRPVLDILLNFYQSAFKIPSIILRFHVIGFKGILITPCMSNVWSEVSSRTLTTNPSSISISDIWTLQNLDGLVSH